MWIETDVEGMYRVYAAVTPHVGVWIETHLLTANIPLSLVTPHVGVWIETERTEKDM